MKIIDITRELNEKCEVYEGDPHFEKHEVYSVEKDGFKLSRISMGTHTGTHTDAPSHFIENGKSLAHIPLKKYIGKCKVIYAKDMASLKDTKRVILKSSPEKSARINLEDAKLLVEKGIKLVGTETLSIGNDDVHKYLLKNDCIIIETLYLDHAKEGEYMLFAMPLKIDADGAPIRCCLISEDHE